MEVSQNKRRRGFRFSLRALLVLTALAGLLLGWIVNQRAQSQRELQIAQELGQRAYIRLSNPFVEFQRPSSNQSWLHRQLGSLLGPIVREARIIDPTADELAKIAELKRLYLFEMSKSQLSLAPLSDIQTLKDLRLHRVRQLDLAPIANFKQLHSLEIRFTPVVDLRVLSQLPKLSSIWLADTQFKDFTQFSNFRALKGLYVLEPYDSLDQHPANIPDVSPLATLKNLQGLGITINAATDLRPFGRLVNLRGLFLDCEDSSQVSDDKVLQLQAALPNCEITVGQMHGSRSQHKTFKARTPRTP
jgi:Leucine-rich repeat (LRR) protein